MFRAGLRLWQAALPISKEEFLESISRACPSILDDHEIKFGLAVSGGVDSMALATMCRKYLPGEPSRLKAVIIDHGLRSSSTDEALKTQAYLKQNLDIDADVLRFSRHTHDKVIGSTHVETSARDARMESLFERASYHRISRILLAHHADDQYETVLMRLSRHGRTHLTMPTRRPMYRSKAAWKQISMRPVPPETEFANADWRVSPSQRFFGLSGVAAVSRTSLEIVRPLLDYRKARLMATCQHFGVDWVEDETNADRTYASRNAVRHVVSHSKLPQALSFDALTGLGQSLDLRSEQIYAVAKRILDLSHLQLDLRTGALVFSLPNPQNLSLALEELATMSQDLSSGSIRKFASILTRHLVGLLTIVKQSGQSLNSEKLFYREKFAVRDIVFDPLQDGKWCIHRADPVKDPRMWGECIKSFPSTTGMIRGEIFDRRWYVSLNNPSSGPITLRYMRPCHWRSLCARLKAGHIRIYDIADPNREALSARDLLRSLRIDGHNIPQWSIPVLVTGHPPYQSGAPSEGQNLRPWMTLTAEGAENIVAFPTLNVKVAKAVRKDVPEWVEDLKWEMVYKSVDLGAHTLDDVLVLPDKEDAP